MNPSGWQAPPGDILGTAVPARQLIARSANVVVALIDVVAYPYGCAFTIHVAARRVALDDALDDAVWQRLCTGDARAGSGLTLTVRHSGGTASTETPQIFSGPAAGRGRRAGPPVLVETGTETSSGDQSYRSARRLWLWPLPPPGPVELTIAWAGMGIEAATTTLDGAAIAAAAARAQPYWP